MTLAYHSEEGEEIAQECIRRYRLKTMAQTRHKCMIVSGDHYGIFDLEELMMLVGQRVRCPMRTDEEQFRKLHALQPPGRHARTVPTAHPLEPLPLQQTGPPCRRMPNSIHPYSCSHTTVNPW